VSADMNIREGMILVGSDGEIVGTVEHVTHIGPIGELKVAGGLLFPTSAITRVDGEQIFLPHPASQYLGQTGPQSQAEVPIQDAEQELIESESKLPPV
jgi:hypothetical protein